MPSGDPFRGVGPSAKALQGLKIAAGLAALVIVGLTVWAIWTASRPEPVPPPPSLDRFETAWTSAMSKAGVVATYPAEPVELSGLKPTGRRRFEATFTAEEVTALLNVYRHTPEGRESLSLREVQLSFPAAGQVRLTGSILMNGTPYDAQAAGPAAISAGHVQTRGLTELEIEGFAVEGDRRSQAGEALVRYFNAYLATAPGLTVESAEVIDGGVRVSGFAPTSISNPAE